MGVTTTIKRWTLEELHSLPDDGNRYELVHGELFVTPPPTFLHETVVARLTRVLFPFVTANNLGLVYSGKSALRLAGSELQPDLMVRAEAAGVMNDWENAPLPILVVEVASDSTRRRDLDQKRRFYMEDAGIPEYWSLDPELRRARVMRHGNPDLVVTDRIIWQPSGASGSLGVDLAELFQAGPGTR